MENVRTTPQAVEQATACISDKATGPLRRALAWLEQQPPEGKLTLLLGWHLLRHEGAFKSQGVYKGDIAKVIEACPDTQWKVIFALARYGGLRTPSETLALRWEDINWEQGRMLVAAGPCDPTQRPLLAPRGFEPLLPG